MARKKKETPPQAEQFEEVAPPTAGSEQVFTTSTPTVGKGRIVGDDTATEADVSGPDPLRPRTSSTSLEDADKLARELGQVPQGATRRAPGTNRRVARREVVRKPGTDQYTEGVLRDLNEDRAATHEKGIVRKIKLRKNEILLQGIYKDHNNPEYTCTTKGCQGKNADFKTFHKAHTRAPWYIKAQADAQEQADSEIRGKKDPVTGELENTYTPLTAADLQSNNAAHLHTERLAKLADMLFKEHVEAVGKDNAVPEAYTPDKVRQALNLHINLGRGTTRELSYQPGLGKRTNFVYDTATAMKHLPGIALWRDNPSLTHQEAVSALWSSMNSVRSREAQKSNPGSGIARAMSELPPQQAAARLAMYDEETDKSRVVPGVVKDDLHTILMAHHAYSKRHAEVSRDLFNGNMDRETADLIRESANRSWNAVVPKISGERITANVTQALRDAHQKHEAAHLTTQEANISTLSRRPSKKERESAAFDTCSNPECNAARKAAAEASGGKTSGLPFESWSEIHGHEVGESGVPAVTKELRAKAASENRRRINTALSTRTPGAVDDLLTQNNGTAEGSNTAISDNNASEAVDHVSEIQRAISSGAVLVPGARTPRARGSVPSGERLPAILGENIKRQHFPAFRGMPPRVQQQMLRTPPERHDEFIDAYNTHTANERSKVQAADKAGTMYTPKDFDFTS